tara:strand:- start:57 stop:383 length:327 start_codon:yes stop_codon:yes gene_type:complete
MAFKLKNPYDMRLMNTSVSHIEDDANVLGRTTSSGNITLSKDIPHSHIKSVIKHELGHVDDVKNGDLSWDDKFFYWKGQKYLKEKWQGRKDAPWEADANRESGTNYGR